MASRSLQRALLCFFAMLVFVEEGYCINCYVCNSHNDTRCQDKSPPEEFKVPCPKYTKDNERNEYVLCRKITQIIDFEVNNLPPDNRVIRACGWYNKTHNNRCYHRSGFGGRQEVCACDNDYCNLSPRLTFFAPLIAIPLALFKML